MYTLSIWSQEVPAEAEAVSHIDVSQLHMEQYTSHEVSEEGPVEELVESVYSLEPHDSQHILGSPGEGDCFTFSKTGN